jgi:hypothetical protein
VPTPKWIRGTSATPASTRALCGWTAARYWAAGRAPTQESNSWTALAPASICTRRKARVMPASRSISAAQSSGSPYISVLVAAWFLLGPPSTR